MGRLVVVAVSAAALLCWAGAAPQLFAAPAAVQSPGLVSGAQPVVPTAAGFAPLAAPAPAAPPASRASAQVAAALCAGAAVVALGSRGKRAAPGLAASPEVLRAAAPRRAAAPTMIVDPAHAMDAASALIAARPETWGPELTDLAIPIGASPGKAFIMGAANLMVICGMRVQGHGLLSNMQAGMSPKEAHDDMVNSLGLTWLLSGASFGHVVGAAAILGCEAGGLV